MIGLILMGVGSLRFGQWRRQPKKWGSESFFFAVQRSNKKLQYTYTWDDGYTDTPEVVEFSRVCFYVSVKI